MCVCFTILASTFLEQWYLIYWPEEESYSEVPPSKLVEPKKPAIGDKVKVKDGKKVHTGEVVGFGSKAEIEELMLHLEHDDEEETTAEGEQGTVHVHVHVRLRLIVQLLYKLHVFKCIYIIYFFSTWSYGR